MICHKRNQWWLSESWFDEGTQHSTEKKQPSDQIVVREPMISNEFKSNSCVKLNSIVIYCWHVNSKTVLLRTIVEATEAFRLAKKWFFFCIRCVFFYQMRRSFQAIKFVETTEAFRFVFVYHTVKQDAIAFLSISISLRPWFPVSNRARCCPIHFKTHIQILNIARINWTKCSTDHCYNLVIFLIWCFCCCLVFLAFCWTMVVLQNTLTHIPHMHIII